MSFDPDILENLLGYSFKDRRLLLEALTHPSFAYEQNSETRDNQRLEFLGDAVLQLVVTDYLFAHYPQAPEGVMTKMRAGLVCEQTLVRVAHSLELGRFLRLGHGESLSGGASNPSNLSDALEALLGAVYIEGGIGQAAETMIRLLTPYFRLAADGQLTYDYKSRLFEWAQAHRDMDVKFLIQDTSGPDHERQYSMGLYIDGQLRATGKGRTKKAAEQDASFRFLNAMTGDAPTPC